MGARAGATRVKRPPKRQQELEFAMTHFFAVPRELVFRMMIDPLLIPNWWGPSGRRTEVGAMDVRPGGEWRFVQYDDEGDQFGFHGMYEEVEFPSRLTYSLEHEGEFGENRTEILTFAEAATGRTELTVTDVFETRRARDEAMDAGLVEDFAASMDRLAKLLGDRGEEAGK